MIDAFLLGVVATCSLLAGIYFFKFYRETRDRLFLSFALAFTIEALNRTAMLLGPVNEGRLSTYLVRFLAFSLIVAGIISKNRQKT